MVSNKDEKKVVVSLSIRENIWKKYKKYCKKHNLTPSYEVEDVMSGELL